MKVYKKPSFDFIEIRPEERLALASCIEYGCCGSETTGICESHWYNYGPE